MQRADHRLVVWLKHDDFMLRSADDLRTASGKKLVHVFEDPKYFGFSIGMPPWMPRDRVYMRSLYEQAAPEAVGTLVYITYETRRLFDAIDPKGETFQPVDVQDLVRTEADQTFAERTTTERGPDLPAHATGQVFDVKVDKLPHTERECLRFVLDDLGWGGYLGFKDESDDTIHIGCAPSARNFFAAVYEDAVGQNASLLAGTPSPQS